MGKAFQIFGEAALIRAAKKPFGQGLGIVGWQILVVRVFGQLNYSLRPQHAIQMLVQENLGKRLQKRFIKLHKPFCRLLDIR